MADNNQQRQGNQNQPKKQGGGGDQTKFFVSYTRDGSLEKVKPAEDGKPGEYDVSFMLGATKRVQNETPVEVRIQGKHVDTRFVEKDFTFKDVTIHNVKLDKKKPVEITVLKAGFPDSAVTFDLQVNFNKLQSSKAAVKAESKYLHITVRPLTPQNVNPVDIFFTEQDGITPKSGDVLVYLGQQAKFTYDTDLTDVSGVQPIEVGIMDADKGRCSMGIQLLECDGPVRFVDRTTNEEVVKYLLKSP